MLDQNKARCTCLTHFQKEGVMRLENKGRSLEVSSFESRRHFFSPSSAK